MPRTVSLLLLILTLVLWESHILQGAEGETDSLVKLSLQTIALAPGDFDGIAIRDWKRDSLVPLHFGRYRRSVPLEIQTTLPLVFYRESGAVDSESPASPVPVATYSLSPVRPIKNLLLFFLPLPEPDPVTGAHFRIYGMDDSLQVFPRDTAIVFNATGAELYGRFNGSDRRLKSGANGPFPLRRPLDVAIAVHTADGPKLVFENRLEFNRDQRVIVMLQPPRRARSLRIVSYNIVEPLDPPPDQKP